MIAPTRDSFAAWNDERDRAADHPLANRFVSPEMTGAADLDNYGGWEQTPDYGPVWIPRGVSPDWAPYSAGHWAWVQPWGWTWVDDAPWGFAPFHYGRWVNYRDTWCWAPGTYVARPVYAPALVAWIGGPRVGVSLSIGGGGPPVGWFPLAPHEVYVPSYRASPGYVRNVNFTHVTNVTIINNVVNNTNGAADHREFMNRRFPNAVTVVPSNVFTGRQQVGPAAAQYRGNPQVRAFIADARPGQGMNAAPVAGPAFTPRGPEARPAVRPPFESRNAGNAVEPRNAGNAVGRPGSPGVGSPPPPIGARPAAPQGPGQRQGQGGDLPRPPLTGRPDAVGPRGDPNPARRIDAPPRIVDAPPRTVDAPPRSINAPPRSVDAPPRSVDAPQRPGDTPRGEIGGPGAPQARPVDATRQGEVPKVGAPEAARPAKADPRANRPEAAPRNEEKRGNEKKEEKS